MSGAVDPAGEAVLRAIHERRSVGKVDRREVPRALVRELLAAAVSAPNHLLTAPWRFVVLSGSARGEAGAAHARAVARTRSDASPEVMAKEASRLERAPVVIACCVAPGEDPVVAREDRDAVAAAIQNLLLAAHARGLAAMWRTGAMADEPEVAEALGLGPRDAVVGFVYLGWPLGPPGKRPPRETDPDAFTIWREG